MEIKTLKDLKEALKDIPNDVLDKFGAGIFEDEFVELLCWDGGDEDDPVLEWGKLTKKYPVLEDIGKWIENISKVQDQTELQDDLATEDPISSEDKISIEVKSKEK